MNFVDDAGDDIYIEDMDEDNEAEHGDKSNTPSDDICGDMMEEENPEKDGIADADYDKYIGASVIMDLP